MICTHHTLLLLWCGKDKAAHPDTHKAGGMQVGGPGEGWHDYGLAAGVPWHADQPTPQLLAVLEKLEKSLGAFWGQQLWGELSHVDNQD
ncbi:hypothetical protein P7K49_033803 [Saguinus oedipus]|uniref:Uncharacterized protein n=1 Tax=Saguinus oedipus TaxID=9490 RepID=A0ABQ9TSZ1_SAGOE|nr:hypothetical protein P7K49_033803 [Saguinus oedipus]